MLWMLMLCGAIVLFLIVFYRDPERIPDGDGMVSPADGKIIDVGRKVSIFMRPWDVHTTRAPLDGIVEKIERVRGGFSPAFSRKADLNSQNVILLRTQHGEVEIRQIAGVIARRIKCYVKEGDEVRRGDRIGKIVLGSRVDVTIPEDMDVILSKGSVVRGGRTIIARVKAP